MVQDAPLFRMGTLTMACIGMDFASHCNVEICSSLNHRIRNTSFLNIFTSDLVPLWYALSLVHYMNRYDQRDGKGTYHWNDGRVYSGGFVGDRREGRFNKKDCHMQTKSMISSNFLCAFHCFTISQVTGWYVRKEKLVSIFFVWWEWSLDADGLSNEVNI